MRLKQIPLKIKGKGPYQDPYELQEAEWKENAKWEQEKQKWAQKQAEHAMKSQMEAQKREFKYARKYSPYLERQAPEWYRDHDYFFQPTGQAPFLPGVPTPSPA